MCNLFVLYGLQARSVVRFYYITIRIPGNQQNISTETLTFSPSSPSQNATQFLENRGRRTIVIHQRHLRTDIPAALFEKRYTRNVHYSQKCLLLHHLLDSSSINIDAPQRAQHISIIPPLLNACAIVGSPVDGRSSRKSEYYVSTTDRLTKVDAGPRAKLADCCWNTTPRSRLYYYHRYSSCCALPGQSRMELG